MFFDTEFTGLHKNTTLVSIGLVSETGETFYAELTDYDNNQVDDWIKENVIQHLWINEGRFSWDYPDWYHAGTCKEIGIKLREWIESFKENVELVSDVAHYDMVLLINLFGTAFDIPENLCPACYDINQDIARYHNCSLDMAFNVSREQILQNNNVAILGTKHNALYDAKVIQAIYNIIK